MGGGALQLYDENEPEPEIEEEEEGILQQYFYADDFYLTYSEEEYEFCGNMDLIYQWHVQNINVRKFISDYNSGKLPYDVIAFDDSGTYNIPSSSLTDIGLKSVSRYAEITYYDDNTLASSKYHYVTFYSKFSSKYKTYITSDWSVLGLLKSQLYEMIKDLSNKVQVSIYIYEYGVGLSD